VAYQFTQAGRSSVQTEAGSHLLSVVAIAVSIAAPILSAIVALYILKTHGSP
jgi:hypothetical protein